jgi:deazaflavin-dependent oxidoreductase (nitroreductase family)
MPAPLWVGRFQSRVVNHLVRPLAPYLPGFGVLTHTGRRTGRQYSIPLNVFPRGDRYFFALTYGPGTDWVRNVLASGTCTLRTRRGRVRLIRPRLFRDEQRRPVPAPLRPLLRLMRVYDFLEFQATSEAD